MSCEAILSELRTRRIRLWVNGGRLRCSAPKGAMTPELEDAIGRYKSDLLGLLSAAGTREREAVGRVPRMARMPLSFGQEQFWFLTKLSPGSGYNIAAYWEVPGEVDAGILGRAVAAVVARHEILRTRFFEHGGMPSASISPDVPTPFEVMDVPNEPLTVLKQLAQQPFDLSSAPLIRTTLMRRPGAPAVFGLVVHHIVSDGWSLGVLFKELALAYDALSRGAVVPWPELPVQYADYVAWQREQVEAAGFTAELDYWERKLKDCPTTLQLPRARPAAGVWARAARPSRSRSGVGRPKASEHCAHREGATPYMVLASIYGALLFRYTGQASILIGVPVANRVRPEFEDLIGLFMNALVLRADPDRDQTARSLVRQVRESILELHAHSEVPFEKIVERVRPQRTTSSNPLFQVALVLQNTPHSDEYRTVTGGSVSDLTLYAWERPGGDIECTLEYRTDMFSPATVERISGHLANLAADFACDPDRPIGCLELLGDAEHDELLALAERPREEYPSDRCLHELIRQKCRRTPNRIAVACGQELTFGELDEASDRLAARLEQLGVRPGVSVGIGLERSVRIPVALLGVLKAGGAYVPLDPRFPRQRLADILEDSGAAVLITERSLAGRIPAAGAVPLWMDEELPPGRPTNAASPDDLAYIIYTSGSTGRPKGVEVPHRALVNFLHSMRREPGMQAGDRLLAVTTLCFDIAALEIYLPLLVGAAWRSLRAAPRSTGTRCAGSSTSRRPPSCRRPPRRGACSSNRAGTAGPG